MLGTLHSMVIHELLQPMDIQPSVQVLKHVGLDMKSCIDEVGCRVCRL